MITIFTSNCNQISQSYYNSIINSIQFHRLTCSGCKHSSCLSIHGYYTRTVKIPDYRFAKQHITLRYTPDMKDIFIVEADSSLTKIRLLNKQENALVKRDKVHLTGGDN